MNEVSGYAYLTHVYMGSRIKTACIKKCRVNLNTYNYDATIHEIRLEVRLVSYEGSMKGMFEKRSVRFVCTVKEDLTFGATRINHEQTDWWTL